MVVILILAILLGTALLTLVFSIPNRLIEPKAAVALEQLDGTWHALKAKESGLTLWEWLRYYVDFYTDRIMITSAVVDNASLTPLQAAMHVNDYARYWHGYLVLIRPLLLVLDYNGLVLINAIVFLLLLAFCMVRIAKRCGVLPALLLLIVLIVTRIVSLILCMSFSVSFDIAMLLMIAVSYYAVRPKEHLLLPLFFASGIAIGYFEQLMTPLVALGLPLLLYVLIHLKEDADFSLRKSIPKMIQFSIVWGIGYGVFWAAKWVIGSLVLGRNVLTDAIGAASYRIAGDVVQAASPVSALGLNFGQTFYHRTGLFLAAGAVLVVFGLVFHKPWREWLRALPLLLISLYPLLWICVLSNHSEIHYYFTFRMMTILLFGAGLYLLQCIDLHRFRRGIQAHDPK